MAHIKFRDLARVRAITAVLARHGFGHLLRQAGIDFDGEPIEVRLPIGRRIRFVLSDLGPTFVKLGQVLSVRPDIVPPEVIEELSELQDRVPPAPFDEIRGVLEAELGASLAERFASFDPEPLASASIAQVHAARLPDGREVAVKVQRPGIEDTIRSDLHILYTLAHLASGTIEFPGLYTPVEVVQEFEAAIYRELDFLQEAQACRRFREDFRGVDGIRAPEIHAALSTRRVLVMERIRGTRLIDLLEDRAAMDAAMKKIIEATYLQVFEHGFFHGDPHPGNLVVEEDGTLCYLDFGITGLLTGEMQDTLVALFLGLVYREPESVALTLVRAGATEGRIDLKAFSREVERLMAKYHGATLRDLSSQASLMEFVQVAARFRIRLVPEYAVLARATSILDGIARRFLPDVDIVEEVRPYAQRLVSSRLSAGRLGGDALRLLHYAQIAVRDVPMQLNQLLGDLEHGSLTIRVVDPDAERLRVEVRHAGARVALAVCCGALAVGGAILIAPDDPRPLGIPVRSILGVLVGLTGVSLFVGLATHFLVAARLHPRDWVRAVLALVRFFRGGGGSR